MPKFLTLLIFCFTALSVQAAPKYHGDWFAASKVDKMTDQRTCHVLNRRDPHVIYDSNGLFTVSFLRRGGVSGYQWRVDKNPPSPYQIPTRGDDDYVRVSEVSSDLRTANKLVITGLTVTKHSIDLDYDLRGIDSARKESLKLCGLEDPLDRWHKTIAQLFVIAEPSNEANHRCVSVCSGHVVGLSEFFATDRYPD